MKPPITIMAFVFLYAISISAHPALFSGMQSAADIAYLQGGKKYQEWIDGDDKALIEAERYYSSAWNKFQLDINLQRNLYLVRYALAGSSWHTWSSKLTDIYSVLDPWVKRQVNPPRLLKLILDLESNNLERGLELEQRILKILRDNPKSISIWVWLSRYHEQQQNYEVAIEAAKIAEELQFSAVDRVYEIGNLYYLSWSSQECSIGTDYLAINSLKYLLEANKKASNNSFLQNRLSFSYRMLGIFPLAIDFGKKALMNEENKYTLKDLAYAALFDGQYALAAEQYQKLAKKYDGSYYYELAQLAVLDQNFKKYKKYYKLALESRYFSYTERLIHNQILRHFDKKAAKSDLEALVSFAAVTKFSETRWNKITYNYIVNDWQDENYFDAAKNVCDVARGRFYRGLKLWSLGDNTSARCEIKKSMSYGAYITAEYSWAKILIDSGIINGEETDCGANEIVRAAAKDNTFSTTVEEYIWALGNAVSSNVAVDAKLYSSEMPTYPDWAKFYRVEGYAVVKLLINEAGIVESIDLIEESPEYYYFGDAAIRAARKRRYYPKVDNGIPVKTVGVSIRYNFELPK